MSHKIAPNSLDFHGHQSVTIFIKRLGNGMDSTIINEAIKACLGEIHRRLSEAARIAKAAEACAIAGSVTEAVTVKGYRATNLRGRTAA
jgi:hypothetical protein